MNIKCCFWLLIGHFCCITVGAADPPPAPADELIFREPFSGLSASEIESKLIVFLITDEDPFLWSKAKLERADKNRLGGGPDVWCGGDFRQSFAKMVEERPDLKDRIIAQRIVAGLPSNLTGGNARSLPPRVMIAICDGNYRLLNLCVGMPDGPGLIQVLEDAEENRALLELNDQDPEKLGLAISQRTRNRVRRIYDQALTQLHENTAWDDSLGQIDSAWIAKFGRLAVELQPVYLLDVKLRFSLSDLNDLIRLIVLEQHTETRRNWCDTIAPYVVGRPLREIINPLVDVIWATPSVVHVETSEHTDVLRWFSSRRENVTLVLAIEPALIDRGQVWPPPNISGNRNARQDWAALETAMSKHPFRTVDAEELAVVLRENDEMPIDLNLPSRTRYIIFEPGKKKMFLIREGDLPGKFIQRLE
ncbi:hypothetical protein NHH03_06515 [Stieleria sp. TO1_6]|uniref:hypothetical protein n=1 Tax=Stieleria tagensis TaxID=2956795 RepID=UPI00209AD97F|nr:hypothetical protein [Stieleria tagensis]MCO8121384.1 hypothetical protein [Stieleria tagensis]